MATTRVTDQQKRRRSAGVHVESSPPETSYRPPYLAAAIAGASVLLLYAVTLARTTQFWDASEYIATAHLLGIPHPPGNPLFVVFARAWELLLAPTGLTVAVRINLFSAIMGALAHACWFIVVHRVLAYYSADRVFRLAGAGAAVAISAAAFTVWNHSNVNEKVYTVSLFTIALLSWLAFHWRDHLGRGKDDNLILLMVFILALSVGNHLMAFLAAPAVVLLIVMVEPRTLLNWKLYAGAAAVALLGLSIHLYLPLRASLDPVINEADPSTLQALWQSLTRQQYNKPSFLVNPIYYPLEEVPRNASMFIAQVGHYLQYFDWQWARSLAGHDTFFGGARPLFTLVFTALGAYGAWTHYRRDRVSWAYFAALFAVLSLGLIVYLNFKYGYSYPVEAPNEAREVRERDYFYIASFSVWGLWAGIGLAALWQRIAAAFARSRDTSLPNRAAYLRTSPIMAVAFLPLALNWSWASRANDYVARDWAYNLLMSVEPYAVLFTNGDNDTFPLWYLQEVEGIRQDVTVIVASYLNTAWYATQLRDITTPCPPGVSPEDDPTRILCQRPYRAEDGPSFYAQAASRQPTRSILPLSDAEIAEIAGTGAQLQRESLTLPLGGIEGRVQAGSVLAPSDIFQAYIINSAIDDRPIYFATTTNSYQTFGLRDYLIRQGLAFRLNNGPVDPEQLPDVVEMPQQYHGLLGRYLDVARTDSLLWNVFEHRNGLPDTWTRWVDIATRGIPYYYLYTHFAAATAHDSRGDAANAARHLERVTAWQRLAEVGM
ncbi:MAG TPA: DUF2723 domain-containing protein [Longimicrobiales bacterium]|nr:DUF2723 domain-containing protein [Longimicrobiales bacterium]